MKRIMGLGKGAQGILLWLYRVPFEGRRAFGGGSDVERLIARGLVARQAKRGSLRLTPAGRSAVARIAPLWFALALLMLAGCGEAFEPDWSACFGGPRVVERGGFQAPPTGSVVEPKRYPDRPTPDAGAGRTK